MPGGAVAILADTHLPKGRRALPERCIELLRGAGLIVHAGDLSRAEILSQLESFGPPVLAVHGNVDEPALRDRLPARLTFDCEGHEIGVIHDAGPRRGRLDRMRREFPSASAVIFGHSHLPLHERDADGFQIFNPGSPTERRRAPAHTMGFLRAGAEGPRFELVEL